MVLFSRYKVKTLLVCAFIAGLWLINVKIYNKEASYSSLPYQQELIALFSLNKANNSDAIGEKTGELETVKPNETVKNGTKSSEVVDNDEHKDSAKTGNYTPKTLEADSKQQEPVKESNKPSEHEQTPGGPVKVDEKPQESTKPDEKPKEPKPNNKDLSKQEEEPPQNDEDNKIREDFRPIGNPNANHTTVNTSVTTNRTIRLETFVMIEKLQNILVDVKATFKNYEVVYKMSKPDNESFCDGVDAVVYVMAMADQEAVLRRQALRETIFHSDNLPTDKKILYRFVLGRMESEENYQQQYKDEIEKFNDIIFYNVEETYRDNYIKWHTMHAWHMRYCSQVKHFIKMDDDTVADFRRTFLWMDRNFDRRISKNQKYFVCHRMSGYRVFRDPVANPRWYITPEEFQEDIFPDYCYGYFVIYTNDTVKDIMRAQEDTNLVHMDDCFYTGIVRRETNSKLYDFEGIRTGIPPNKCSQDNVLPYMIASTDRKTPDKIRLRLHTIKNKKCEQVKDKKS
ncbi:unnamed protein product [Bursaphelenchus okinawaensis]|uniref:Hexosyltransferase n=1 Tax=Bursaphelenchus okinawaensis TaxID=465554 RepID=A0A811JRJ8_9BILA|nr:unnamed protein product [Bursaphelenchus okinawaensis]CAG9079714.1 unnamed protein product [Bursaphelenchus okinawaensis]